MTSETSESPSPQAPPERAPTRPRWLSWLLGVSLALNVFALGFLAARALRPHDHPRDRDRRHGAFFGPHGLLDDDAARGARPIVERVMKQHHREMRSEHRELRAARRRVRDALEAEPFDRQALERALSELRARTESSHARVHAALVELASELPKAERKKLGRRAHVLEGGGGPAHPQR